MRTHILILILSLTLVSTQLPARSCHSSVPFLFSKSEIAPTCEGPRDGAGKGVEFETTLNEIHSDIAPWTYEVNIDAKGNVDGPNESGFNYKCNSALDCNLTFKTISSEWNTVVFVLNVNNLYSFYRFECFDNGNLNGSFGTYGVTTGTEIPDSVSVYFAYSKACDPSTTLDSTITTSYPTKYPSYSDMVITTENIDECIEKLKERIHYLESQNTELLIKLTNCEKDREDQSDYISELEEDLKDCNEDNEEVVRTNREINDQINELYVQSGEMNETIRDLEAQIEQKDRELESCDHNVQSLTEQLEHANIKINQLQGVIADLSGQIAQLTSDLKKCEGTLSNANIRIQELLKEIERIKAENAALISTLNEETAKVINTLHKEIETMQATILALREEIVNLNVKLTDKDITIKNLSDELAELEDELGICQESILNLSEQYETCMNTNSILEERIRYLSEANEELKKTINDLRGIIASLEKQYYVCKEEKIKINKELEDCETILKCKNNTVEDLKSKFNIFLYDFETCEKNI